MEEHEAEEICKRYAITSSRAAELFEGIKDLPRFGVRKWQIYFMKTFNVFTELWKYQAENRLVLIENAKLKRSEIGDLASKIGQLYYHYYLHTSDPKYLTESCEFYAAISSRQYFRQNKDEFDLSVELKSLRYIARYLVVALVLRKFDLMQNLIEKLTEDVNEIESSHVESYEKWTDVVKEAKAFLNGEHFLSVVDGSMREVDVTYRLSTNTIADPVNNGKDIMCLKLDTAIVIGCCEKQIKLSELTVDLYRMLLLLEYQSTSATSEMNESKKHILANPKKHLLYKPTFDQVYAYLSAVSKDLESNGVLLVYFSGDAVQDSLPSHHQDRGMYTSGIPTSSFVRTHASKTKPKPNHSLFYSEDLIPFTRKPLVVIIDTNNSTSFRNIPNTFNQPLLCLMSPVTIPNVVRKNGSLFTTFLLDPLLGICQLCKINRIPHETWQHCKQLLQKIESQVVQVLLQDMKTKTPVFSQFLHDPFLQRITSNYLICWMILRLYKESKDMKNLPSSSPAVSADVLEHKVFFRYLLEITFLLNVRAKFHELSELPPIWG